LLLLVVAAVEPRLRVCARDLGRIDALLMQLARWPLVR
jgi:hypothetical protein